MSEDNNNNAREPFSNYGKRIQVFSSFEEEEQSKLDYAAGLTHYECLIDLRKYINRFYGVTGHEEKGKRSISIVFYKD